MCAWVVLWVVMTMMRGGFASLANDKQGPYNILVRFVQDCSDGDDVKLKVYPKLQRVDRKTVYVSGSVMLKIPLDSNIKFSIQLDQKTSQGYKENFFYTDFKGKDLCSVVEEYGDESDSARLFGAFKDEDRNYTSCPVDEGKHIFKIAALVEPFKKVPVFFYNTYRVFLRFYEDLSKPPDGCLMFIVDLIPKTRKKG